MSVFPPGFPATGVFGAGFPTVPGGVKPKPTVTSVTPTSGGATAGGTSVTIHGSNLTGATSVTFGGSTATTVAVVNATTITCKTPAHTLGVVTVSVTTPGGTGTKATGFSYGGYVQTLVSQASATSSTSHTFTVASGATTRLGSAIVMSLHTGGGDIASSASDSRGNIYHVVGTPVASGSTVTVLWAHLTTALQNGDTITVIQTGSNTARLTAIEVYGLGTPPVIASNYKHISTAVTSITSTSVSPGANTNVYWFSAWGANSNATGTGTPSTGYTKRTSGHYGATSTSSATADHVASVNTSRNVTWSYTPAGNGTVCLVAFLQ